MNKILRFAILILISVLVFTACFKPVKLPQAFILKANVGCAEIEECNVNKKNFTKDEEFSFIFSNKPTSEKNLNLYKVGNKYKWDDFSLPTYVCAMTLSAIYPSISEISEETSSWDIRTKGASEELLLVRAFRVVKGDKSPYNLSFRPVLHKLSLELSSEDGSISQAELETVEVFLKGVVPVARLSLVKGTFEGVEGDKTILKKTGAHVDFIFPPQVTVGMSITYKFPGKAESAPIKLEDELINGSKLQFFGEGKRTTYRLKVVK